VGALVGVDPAEVGQSEAGVARERRSGEVDAVVHRGAVVEFGAPIGVGDRHIGRADPGVRGEDPQQRIAALDGSQDDWSPAIVRELRSVSDVEFFAPHKLEQRIDAIVPPPMPHREPDSRLVR
jgi:hypothetical protein